MSFSGSLIILQATPVDGAMNTLLQYGVLGVFAILLVVTLRWLAKEYKKQNDKIIDAYIEQIKGLVGERNKTLTDKEDLNDKFLKHLQDTESKLLEIITENSKAFSEVAESNRNVADSVSLLIETIHNRNDSTNDLNESIKTIIKNNNNNE